ncbi:hypothetical protein A176_002514 [Myxococcus hansupus]|uniref:Uncharacterized protein n=1 Tax=Pseudomyxococcus hansupus TaxID=1297742 RepID=A0A0H4XCA7_9BACT|nr:hypothetical protein A176_002514 [Myxococcus hansupus]
MIDSRIFNERAWHERTLPARAEAGSADTHPWSVAAPHYRFAAHSTDGAVNGATDGAVIPPILR